MNNSIVRRLAAIPFLLAVVQVLSAQSPTPYRQLGREIFRELVETDTTHSHGDTTKAAELLASRFRAAGFPEADIKVIGPEARNKNLVVRYRGSGMRQPILLIA